MLLGSFHEAHIQTFAFSTEVYFKISVGMGCSSFKVLPILFFNENYKDTSLQVCLLFTILSSVLLVGLCVCCWQWTIHQQNLKPVFEME